MVFEWHELSGEDAAKKPNIWAPHATPIMAGGLFAIDRKWFETLGLYDEGKSGKSIPHFCLSSFRFLIKFGV